MIPAFILPILAKITPYLGVVGGLFRMYKVWIYAAIIAVVLGIIGVQHAQKVHLRHEIMALEAEIVGISVKVALQQSIIDTQGVSLRATAADLEQCEGINEKIRTDALIVVDSLRQKVGEIESRRQRELREVRQALEHETCARVSVPLDVEDVLRDAQSRVNTR